MALKLGEIASIICDRISMFEICEMYGIEVRRNFVSCPFHHEKTASLHVNNKFYKCFGCGAGGNAIHFVERLFNLSFRDTVIKLDNDFALGLTNQNVSEEIKRKAKELQMKREKERAEAEEKARYIKELEDEYLTAWKYSLIYAPYPNICNWNINTDEYLVNQYLNNIDSRYLHALAELDRLADPAEIYGFKIEKWEAEQMFLK